MYKRDILTPCKIYDLIQELLEVLVLYKQQRLDQEGSRHRNIGRYKQADRFRSIT